MLPINPGENISDKNTTDLPVFQCKTLLLLELPHILQQSESKQDKTF